MYNVVLFVVSHALRVEVFSERGPEKVTLSLE